MKHKYDFWKVRSLPGTPRCMIISGWMGMRAVDGKKYEMLFVVAALAVVVFHFVRESMHLYSLAASNVSLPLHHHIQMLYNFAKSLGGAHETITKQVML